MKLLKRYRTEIALFFLVWCTYGALISERNMADFALQQLGVESIIERGHFYLEGSQTPQLQLVDDVFTYTGHTYAEKQPGQFMLGSASYVILHWCGLSYSESFILTASLVTFFSASLVAALGAIALFGVIRRMLADHKKPTMIALVVAILYAFGTSIFVYSVLPHHDAIAAGYLAIAFYFAYRSRTESRTFFAFLSALFLGLTVTTSMLALWPALALGVYLIVQRGWRSCILPTAIGLAIGLAPMFYYNYVCFGNALLMPNIAANASDTFPTITPSYYFSKLTLYTKWLLLYSPLILVGIIGIAKLHRSQRAERLMLVTSTLLLFAYLFNIETTGGWQFGPRYLLPIMPFAMIGLIPILRSAYRAARLVLTALFIYSIAINLLGVIGGAMYGNVPHFAAWTYLQRITAGDIPSFPLFNFLIGPAIVSGVMLWLQRPSYK